MTIIELQAGIQELFPGTEVSVSHGCQGTPPWEYWGALVSSPECECCKSGSKVICSEHGWKTPEDVLIAFRKKASEVGK
jgi:hypothetical protein